MRKAITKKPSPRGEAGRAKLELQLEVVTPMFGGGVRHDAHVKPADEVTLVRGSSVRGQLRFWWRAMNPRRLRTLGELRKAEAEVFGSPENAGDLVIAVREQPKVSETKVLEGAFGAVRGMDGIAYGAFPLRDTRRPFEREGPPVHGTLSTLTGAATLELRFDECHRADVEAAVWAWGRYGGLGGRTRRGFGAVRLDAGKCLSSSKSLAPAGLDVPWPHLRTGSGSVVSGRRSVSDALEIHNALLNAFKAFRQQRNLGNQPNRPGRSKWPEPDAIRRTTGRHSPNHAPRPDGIDRFPRGEFGMPIIFHFKDSRDGDPCDTTLKPSNLERWASPIILRPLAEGDGYVAGAVRLYGPRPCGFRLEGARGNPLVKLDITPADAQNIEPLNGEPDPITAFMTQVKGI